MHFLMFVQIFIFVSKKEILSISEGSSYPVLQTKFHRKFLCTYDNKHHWKLTNHISIPVSKLEYPCHLKTSKYSTETPIKKNDSLKRLKYMLMTNKCFTCMKCRIHCWYATMWYYILIYIVSLVVLQLYVSF